MSSPVSAREAEQATSEENEQDIQGRLIRVKLWWPRRSSYGLARRVERQERDGRQVSSVDGPRPARLPRTRKQVELTKHLLPQPDWQN